MRLFQDCLIEAALLGIFMIVCCVGGVVLMHPSSVVVKSIGDPFILRAIFGLAMGVTVVLMIGSPWGKRSGAQFNPAVSLAMGLLGRTEWKRVAGYSVSHFLGSELGVGLSALALGKRLADPSVRFVVTEPGPAGVGVAFALEAALSFALLAAILVLLSRGRDVYVRWVAGLLIAAFITFEAPYSGMSVNPARSFGSAVVAGSWNSFWIYLVAPPLGMVLAAVIVPKLFGISSKTV